MHQTNKNGFVYSCTCNETRHDRFVRYKKVRTFELIRPLQHRILSEPECTWRHGRRTWRMRSLVLVSLPMRR